MKFSMKSVLTRMAAMILTCWLAGCSIFGAPTEIDETRGMQAPRLYEEGEKNMRTRDYDRAIKYFQTLESRYPYGTYATQAQLETAYAYFKKGDPTLCIATADRFIKLHPNHPNLDYAYYLKGLATFNERGIVEKLTKQQISDRDPKTLRESFFSLKELITRYPNSRYSKDAVQRMAYLANALADHEIHVARYYMNRTAYVAGLNRAKFVVENYPDSLAVEEALIIMISAYDALEMTDLKQDTLRILQTNYPQSRILANGAPENKKTWWKFWQGLF